VKWYHTPFGSADLRFKSVCPDIFIPAFFSETAEDVAMHEVL